MNKIVVINNEFDKKKFLRKIKYYKSFFFRNCKFKLESNIKESDLEVIITALNIKNRKERITFVYDSACKKIDDYNMNKNICGFINGKCYTQRLNDKINGCCRKCNHQSSKGCTTSNLTCKLFNCSEVCKRIKTIKYEDLKMLKCLSYQNRVILKHDYFSKREDVLKDLYLNSICLFTIRLIYRTLFKNLDFKR